MDWGTAPRNHNQSLTNNYFLSLEYGASPHFAREISELLWTSNNDEHPIFIPSKRAVFLGSTNSVPPL